MRRSKEEPQTVAQNNACGNNSPVRLTRDLHCRRAKCRFVWRESVSARVRQFVCI
jgi:hypothetical protein